MPGPLSTGMAVVAGRRMRRPYGSSSTRAFLPHQALQQAEILFVAIWPEVQRCGNARELFLFDLLLVLLHEALISPPGYSGGFHRVAFGANRNLVGMQVMEAQLVEERLLDDLMHEEKLRHPARLGPGTKCAREMAVDEDG